MSKLRTDNPLSPEHLIFTVVEVERPVSSWGWPKVVEVHACMGNLIVARAAYDILRERMPNTPLMLVDGKRIIGVSWSREEGDMTQGTQAGDWSARYNGTEGTLECGEYRARFTVDRIGVVKIVWQVGPEPGPHYSSKTRAAYDAAASAVDDWS